jgi:hypothetical protein
MHHGAQETGFEAVAAHGFVAMRNWEIGYIFR